MGDRCHRALRNGVAGSSLLPLALIMSGQASAQDAQENVGIADIIVTAQKREQRLQDVPAAVTAISTDALNGNRVRNVSDLAGIAPNLTVRPSSGGTPLPSVTMRGARSSPSIPGSEKQVGMYIDGVYIGANAGSLFDFPSIERIEVLRGPQGTLFGQSATGGAISVYTPEPTGELGGSQSFTIGNLGQLRARTRLSLPAMGPFSLVLNYEHYEQNGDVRNLGAGTRWDFSGTPRAGLGVYTSPKRLGDINTESFQAALKFEPSDSFRTTYRFFLVTSDLSPEAAGVTGIDVGTIGFFLAGAPAFRDAVVGAINAQTIPIHLKRPDAINNWYTLPMKTRNEGHIVTSNLQITDALSAKNTYGFLKTKVETIGNQLDGFGGLFLAPNVPLLLLANGNITPTKQWSDELQLDFKSKFVTATIGFLHYRLESVDSGPGNTPSVLSFTPVPGFVLPNTFIAPTENTNKADAIYGQAELHVSSDLTILGGLRQTWDRKNGTAGFLNLPRSFSYKDSRITYMIGANYNVTDDILTYAKYSTAYVAGGSYAGVPWNPEVAKSWEAGIKADLFDRRLRANLAVFTVKYGNLQVVAASATLAALTGRPELAALPQVMVNAGDARAKGFELELTLAPAHGLTINGSVGYTDFKYLRTDPLLIGPIDNVRPLIRPKWTSALNVQYNTKPILGDAYLSFRVDANFVGPYETVALDFSPSLSGLGHVPGTLLLNSRVALMEMDLAGVGAEVALWGRNLTNNRNITYSFTAAFANNATYQRARTYGLDLSFKF